MEMYYAKSMGDQTEQDIVLMHLLELTDTANPPWTSKRKIHAVSKQRMAIGVIFLLE